LLTFDFFPFQYRGGSDPEAAENWFLDSLLQWFTAMEDLGLLDGSGSGQAEEDAGEAEPVITPRREPRDPRSKVVLAGHSMGGFLTAAFALAHPAWLHGAVLLSPVGVPPFDPAAHRARRIPAALRLAARATHALGLTPQSYIRLAGPLGPAIVRRTRAHMAAKYAAFFARHEAEQNGQEKKDPAGKQKKNQAGKTKRKKNKKKEADGAGKSDDNDDDDDNHDDDVDGEEHHAHDVEGVDPQALSPAPSADPHIAIVNDYSYHANVARCSGESAFFAIVNAFAYAHRPLAGRLGQCEVPLALIYGGGFDWMDADAGRAAVAQLPRATVALVPDAGHNLFADNPPGFAAAMLAAMGGILSSVG
jgi:pimeloyl-ACP methyl ester carboxylesterase